VLVLANDVVNGNAANAHYLGATLGNLAVGSANANLEKLINKWFYGTDLPATGGYSYDTQTSGTLYGVGGTVSHTDEKQGALGDCYLISSMGSLADSSQNAVKNMMIDNGDGTWTVRFYSNATADYVTVNSRLPVDAKGNLIFQGYGSSSSASNSLWLALVEKAYAQWNETGKTGRSTAANSYSAIEGGWMGDVYDQTLGYSSSSYNMTSSAKQTLINALTGKKAVTIGTVSSPDSGTGLYGGHAYNVLSYNSSTGLFTLYNPWGSNQPNQLTWTQLTRNCDGFAVADTSGSMAIASARGATSIWVIAPRPPELPEEPKSSDSSTAASDAPVRELVLTPVAAMSFDVSSVELDSIFHGPSKSADNAANRLAAKVFGSDFDAENDLLASRDFSELAIGEWLDAVSRMPRI
jgi:hypothetical protein